MIITKERNMKKFGLKTSSKYKMGLGTKVLAFFVCLTGVGMVVGAEQSDAQIMSEISVRPEYQTVMELVEQDVKDFQTAGVVKAIEDVMLGGIKHESLKFRMVEFFPYQASVLHVNDYAKSYGAGIAAVGGVLGGAAVVSSLNKKRKKGIENQAIIQQA